MEETCGPAWNFRIYGKKITRDSAGQPHGIFGNRIGKRIGVYTEEKKVKLAEKNIIIKTSTKTMILEKTGLLPYMIK